jgi:hypothetical protein
VPVIPTLEAFRISVTDGYDGKGKDKKRFIRFAPCDAPDDGGSPEGSVSKTDGSVSSEKMPTDQKADTYADEQGGSVSRVSRTAYLPGNSKYTEGHIDQGDNTKASLFCGKMLSLLSLLTDPPQKRLISAETGRKAKMRMPTDRANLLTDRPGWTR